jgi:isocitrate dehydrogenase
MALIFAWSGAIRKRGELDGTPQVVAFADALESAAIETVESGQMTGDMARIAQPRPASYLLTDEFIDAVAATLADKLAKT